MADDLLVGDLDRAREVLALADLLHQRVARQRAGDLAVLVATHAVGDQPQAKVAVGVVGVLVVLAAEPDVGRVAELDHRGPSSSEFASRTLRVDCAMAADQNSIRTPMARLSRL